MQETAIEHSLAQFSCPYSDQRHFLKVWKQDAPFRFVWYQVSGPCEVIQCIHKSISRFYIKTTEVKEQDKIIQKQTHVWGVWKIVCLHNLYLPLENIKQNNVASNISSSFSSINISYSISIQFSFRLSTAKWSDILYTWNDISFLRECLDILHCNFSTKLFNGTNIIDI